LRVTEGVTSVQAAVAGGQRDRFGLGNHPIVYHLGTKGA
jgi:hypothetical protein